MRIANIISENSAADKKKEIIYNIMHRASPETIRSVSKVVDVVIADLKAEVPDAEPTDGDTLLKEATHATKAALIKKIMSLDVNKPEESAEIDRIATYVNRETLGDVIARTLLTKSLPVSLTRTIRGWFIDGEGTPEEKMQFVELMRTRGYIKTNALMSAEPNNFNNIRKFDSRVYDSVKDYFMQYEGSIGGVGIGKGELYCIFFAAGVTKGAPGDIIVGGNETEVKAVKSRFLATTGYGSTSSFFKTYRDMLQELVPTTLPTDRNWFNWNYKGLHSLNDIFVKSGNPQACKDIIDKTLAALYVDSTPDQRSRVVDVISDDCSFDVNAFLNAWLLMQFDYYKSIDGFDGILFINPGNFNFVYIEDSMQLDDKRALFNVKPSLSWKESRNVTSQISLI